MLEQRAQSFLRKAGAVEILVKRLPPGTKRWARQFFRNADRVLKTLGLESWFADPYDHWVKNFDTLSRKDRAGIIERMATLGYRPLISVVMPVFETPESVLREAIESVRTQLYTNWELCIADDASRAPYIAKLLQEYSQEDSRIKWIKRDTNGNISAATNSALALASGEFVALMDHDDLLSPKALFEIAIALNEDQTLDIIYSDEDQINADGKRCTPYFKTDWNIDLLLGQNMVSHLGVYRRTLLESVGGFRLGYEGSQDYDVALRCAERTLPGRIRHIPSILYHWRRAFGPVSFSETRLETCADAARRAVIDHFARQGERATVGPHPVLKNWNRVTRPIPEPAPLVSLIVPTRDQADLLKTCVDGLLNRTDYPALEILIVDNGSVLPETKALLKNLESDGRVRVLEYKGEFNFSAINNFAVTQASGSIIGLINNDIEVIDAGWLKEMVSIAVLETVGAVGAKLLYPDKRVQHGGVVLGVGGVANHFNHNLPRSAAGYFGRNLLTSSVSAVTGACLIVRKSVYQQVDGLNARDLTVAFNDVDFCLRLIKAGYRNVWTPFAELYHHESATRGAENSSEKKARFQGESDYMSRTWAPELRRDPFYNVNLSTDLGMLFQLAFPPRRQYP